MKLVMSHQALSKRCYMLYLGCVVRRGVGRHFIHSLLYSLNTSDNRLFYTINIYCCVVLYR